MTGGAPEISVICPLHDEGGNVRELVRQVCAALEPLQRPFEMVLVNDGSTDDTAATLEELAGSDARVRPVHLDGNFGEAAALSAGFAEARGGCVLTLDGDLQNDPQDLPRLLERLEEGGFRCVSGWRRRRAESFTLRVLPSRVANGLIALVTGVPARDTGCGLKAYRAEVVRGVCLPQGFHRFMPAVFGVRAHEFDQLEVGDRRRTSGRSHYGLSRFFAVVRDVLTIPYIPCAPRRAAGRLYALLVVGLAGLALAGRGLGAAPAPLTAVPAAAGAGICAYVACVAVNLRRWNAAQVRPTYRVRAGSVDPAGAVPAGGAPRRVTEPGT